MDTDKYKFRPTRKSTDETITEMALACQNVVREQNEKLSSEVKGKWVKIISGYNGQQYGRSRKPLTGKLYQLTGAILDRFHVWYLAEGLPLALAPHDIEFVQVFDDAEEG